MPSERTSSKLPTANKKELFTREKKWDVVTKEKTKLLRSDTKPPPSCKPTGKFNQSNAWQKRGMRIQREEETI